MKKKICSRKITDLVGYDRKIIQDQKMLSFSVDSLLLSNFVTINNNVKKILDLGVGIAPIPLILSLRTDALIDGVEIQKEVFDIACDNIKINNLSSQVKIYNDDMRSFSLNSNPNIYDVIVCNPPFFDANYLKLPSSDFKKISRHEKNISLEEVLMISKKLLKNKGYLAIIFRTERLFEVLSLYRKYNIEPKKIRFIYHDKSKNSKLFFIEGIKNGKVGLKVEAPFIMYDGVQETDEYKKLLCEVKL